MFKQLILSSLLVLGALSEALPHQQQQQPLNEHDISNQQEPKTVDLIHELQTAQIIPDVLNPFALKIRLSITWPNVSADIGNDVEVSAVQDAPVIEVFLPKGKDRAKEEMGLEREGLKEGTRIVVALTDPDAPSREDPEWSQICHWVVYGVRVQSPSSSPLSELEGDVEEIIHSHNDKPQDNNNKPYHHKLDTIIPYKPPGPPPKTGKHRYVFVAMTAANGSSEGLDLSVPKDRRHWGYGDGDGDGKERARERLGVREWMGENGLVVIGANFVYAQNEEQ